LDFILDSLLGLWYDNIGGVCLAAIKQKEPIIMNKSNTIILYTEGHCPEHDKSVEIEVEYFESHTLSAPYPILKKLGFDCECAAQAGCGRRNTCPIFQGVPDTHRRD